MKYRVQRFDALACTDEQLEELFSEGFPPFITADPVAHAYIDRVFECFGKYHIALTDTTQDKLSASGWGVPIRWTGETADLPSGYTDTLRRAIRESEANIKSNTLVICAAIVNPTLVGKGVATDLILSFKELAVASNLSQVIVPLRPTLKHQYPLTPIETYSQWVRSDGLPLDPWLRTHIRLGGRMIAMAPHSQTMTGSVEQWEEWTGLNFPSTGHYVIPKGLSTLYIDREHNVGTYSESNIWVQHL